MEFLFSRDEKPTTEEIRTILREKLESPEGEIEFTDSERTIGYFKSDTGCLVLFDIVDNEDDGMKDVYYFVICSEVHLLPSLKTDNFDELRY